MIVRGEIRKVYQVQEGTSQNGNHWMKQEFVVSYYETPTERFPDSVALSIMNDKIAEYDLHVGDKIEINIYHTTREYQDKPYNEVRFSHLAKINASNGTNPTQTLNNTQNQQNGQKTQENATVEEDKDDLPF